MTNPISTHIPLLAAAIFLASTGVQTSAFELEEIIVTAQKREQNLQDVPVAISAFTGDQLKESVIKDMFDLQTNTPGLRVNQSQSNASSSFSIRGVGTSSQNFGLESSVGMYVDGVYRSRQSSMINDMIDMEAVEILRGPQGTLFGKNTPAGAVLFRTKAPSHETDGYVTVTAGNYNMINSSAAANLSIVEDTLAIRGTFFSSQRDGYIDVDGLGSDVLNDRDRWGARLQALITPNDELSIRVIADYSKISEICCGALTYVDSITAKGRTDVNGNLISGTDSILAALGGTVLTGDQSDSYRTSLNFLPKSKATDQGISIDASWDSGDYTFTSISAYREYDSLDIGDSDHSDVDILSTTNNATQNSFSQEFRVAYAGNRLNAVAGLYYFKQDIDLDYRSNANGGNMLGEYVDLAFGLGDLVDTMNYFNTITSGAFPAGAEGFPDGLSSGNLAKQKQESWAIFGQFDYSITDTLTLTAGLRYTEEDKELTNEFSEYLDGTSQLVAGAQTSLADIETAGASLETLGAALAVNDFSLLADPTFINQFAPYTSPGWAGWLFATSAPREDVSAKLNDEQITGTIKLSWNVSDDLMLYASYGTGYKSGGTNTDRIPLGFEPVFEAETSESFEVGMKSEFPEQALQLNIAAHYTTVDDFQANSFSGTGFILQNAGELETYGAEIELFWQPAQDTVITLAYAYSIADFESFEKGNCWQAYTFHTGQDDTGRINPGDASCDRSGDRISSNPEHYATLGVKQNFEITDGISGYAHAEYSFIGDMVLGQNNDPYKFEDDYGLLNLRAGAHFKEYAMNLTIWGRNVLDDNYKRITFDAPLQSGKLMSYPSEPRTFGITLNKDF